MTPEVAVTRLAEIIASRAEFSEDDLYAAMADAGIPDGVADRAYKFTQTAWGRVFLDGLGIQFATDYLCFDGAGDVIESGNLADQPYYATAIRLVPQYTASPGFAKFALMSSDVSAVNSALNAGSKPEDLVTGPAAFFVEPPISAGMEKARQLLSKRMAKGEQSTSTTSQQPADRKPWWRFW